MKEQIYTLLNEMDNQADSYESSQVSELELKKWKKQFSVRHTRRRSPVKYVAAAAVAAALPYHRSGHPFRPHRHLSMRV